LSRPGEDQPLALPLEGAGKPADTGDSVPTAGAATHPTTSGFRLYWWLSLAIIASDQMTKAIVRSALALFESVPVIAGLVDFIHVQNTGVAFGLLNDLDMDLRIKGALTTALAALALLGIGYYARQVGHHERMARLGLSLILGGAIGNLIDRVRVGYVVDFVDVYWGHWHFWAFNVADASITIGAMLVFIDLLLVNRHVPDSV
jgi:signal peptidase II